MKFILIAVLILGISACAPVQQQTGPTESEKLHQEILDDAAITRGQRQEYIDAHPKLSPEFQQAILDGKVLPGMTKEDVLGIEHVPPSPSCPSSRSVSGEVWDYCVQSMRIGLLVMPEMHETIAFDRTGHVVSVAKSGLPPIRNAALGFAPQ